MKFTVKIVAAALCAAALQLVGSAVSAQERTLRVAVSTAADHPMTLGAQKFAELINARGQGRLKASVFSGAALGNDVQVISSLRGGVIESTIVTVGLLTSMVKEYDLMTMPGLIQDVREADAVLDGPFGTRLRNQLAERNLVGLAYMEHGFKNVSNSKRAVARWEDIDGLKLRVTQSPSLIDTFRRLGANPVPMSFAELYNALESRAVDGIEMAVVTLASSKFDEVQKYLTLTEHIYDPLLLLLSKPVWDALSDGDRKIVSEAAVEASRWQRQFTRGREAKVLAELPAKGIVVTSMSTAEKARMRERLQPVVDKHTQAVGEAATREYLAEIAKARAALPAK